MRNPNAAELLRDFQHLTALGFHPYPVGSDKRPIGQWAKGPVNFVEVMPTKADGMRWASDPRTQGWANLCGSRTRKVFTLDVEAEGVEVLQIADVIRSLPQHCQRPSVSGGRHAVVELTDGEAMPTGPLARVGGVLLAEVRGVSANVGGSGAYAVITGPGRGKLQPDFAPVKMTRAEADALLAPIRALDDPPQRPTPPTAPRSAPYTSAQPSGGGTGQLITGAVLAGSLQWLDVLEDGWTVTSSRGGRLGLLRPAGTSASRAEESANAVGASLTVWSSSVPWAFSGESFNPPQALAASRFSGDFAGAMRAVEEGAESYVTGSRPVPLWLHRWPTGLLTEIAQHRASERERWKSTRHPPIREWDFTAEEAQHRQEESPETSTGAAAPSTLEDAIFGATPQLDYVRQLARAQMVSPYALLGSVLALVLADSPPWLKIPAYIGAPASLNSYFALVGPSGAGKTVSVDIALTVLARAKVTTRTPSSGEGIITLFVDVEKGESVQHTQNVLAVVDEVGTLGAQQARSGSTLASILRSAWSGSTLSTNGADRSRRRHLLAHSYRFVMVMGVQPSTAHYLLDDQGAGTPQRVIWLPATDPAAPSEHSPRPEANLLESWKRPPLPEEVTFPPCVSELVKGTRLSALKGEVTELDGHSLLAREKLAAALALMHRTSDVSQELWDVSGHLMRVSERTRQALLDYRAAEVRRRAESQGRADADRDEAKTSHAVERAVLVLARFVHRNPSGVSRRQLKDAAGRHKALAAEAITLALERGHIREEGVSHRNGAQSGAHYFPGEVRP